MYASYNGPLYQVMRQSDGKTLDVGVVQPCASDGGGYVDAVAQDNFCANTYCWITMVYDQSGHRNHITQAPRGPAGAPMVMDGFNNLPVADWAPITIMGHKAYGVFIVPGMGLRIDNPHGTAVDDQAEGQYWVVNGHHYNGGCCFDYGNGEIDSRDDGNGKDYNVNTYHFAHAIGKPTSNVLFWSVTIVNCPREMKGVRLAIGCNASPVWWVNGKEVIGNYGDRQTVIDDAVSKRLTLNKGDNVVRFALINAGGATDFCARFLNANEEPLKEFTVSAGDGLVH
jgi:hypothetical protein